MVIRELFAKLGLQVDGSGFTRAQNAIGGVKVALAGAGLAVGVIAHKLGHIVEKTTAMGVSVTRASQRLGISTNAYQELLQAADDFGVSGEAMERSLRFLSRNASNAGKAGGEAGAAFRKLGVSVMDASGKLKPADQLFMEISEHFPSIPEAERAALAMRIFGREGTAMVPVLMEGREKIEELRKEAHEMGLVMDKEALEIAHQSHLTSIALEKNILSLERAIGFGLMPKVAAVKKGIVEWISQNRALVRDRVVEWASALGRMILALGRALEPVLDWGGRFLHFLSDATEGADTARVAVAALAAVLGFMFAPATAGLILFLGLLEEVWGWVTGKRKTLLEDAFGPFADLQKAISPDDSPMVQMAKSVRDFLVEAAAAADRIAGHLGFSKPVPAIQAWPADSREGQFLRRNAASARPQGYLTNPLPPRSPNVPNPWDAEWEREQAKADLERKLSGTYVVAPRLASRPSVHVETLNVVPPAGGSPEDYSKAVTDGLSSMFSGAYAAAVKP